MLLTRHENGTTNRDDVTMWFRVERFRIFEDFSRRESFSKPLRAFLKIKRQSLQTLSLKNRCIKTFIKVFEITVKLKLLKFKEIFFKVFVAGFYENSLNFIKQNLFFLSKASVARILS